MKKIPSAALALVLLPAALTPSSAQDQGGITSLPPLKTDAARAAAAKDALERKAAQTPLEEAVAAARRDGEGRVWTEDEGNAGFDAETRARIRILSTVGARDGMRHFKVLFEPKLGVRDNSFEFMAMNRDIRLLRVRGVKKYVAVDFSVGTQYYDAVNFAYYVQHVYDPSLSYRQAGSYATSNGEAQDVTDIDLMADVLTSFMKVGAGDPMIATLRERVKRNAKGRPYIINGDVKTVYLGVGDEGMTIWPEEIRSR
jgi:hypothetical protein